MKIVRKTAKTVPYPNQLTFQNHDILPICGETSQISSMSMLVEKFGNWSAQIRESWADLSWIKWINSFAIISGQCQASDSHSCKSWLSRQITPYSIIGLFG